MKIVLLFISLITPGLVFGDFDHQHNQFDVILKKHVNYQNNKSLVDYAGLKKNDLQNLKKYTLNLSSISKDQFAAWTEGQQLAFLINAYNSFTLQIVANYFPIKSPRDLKFADKELWDYQFIKLWGDKISLNDLEHNLIRKKFSEPRIHFLVNCAARSCPPLQPQAVTADNLVAILESATEGFVFDIDRNRFDQKKNILQLSEIFNWYQADFTKDSNSLSKYFVKFFPMVNQQTKIEFLEYDWLLNSQ